MVTGREFTAGLTDHDRLNNSRRTQYRSLDYHTFTRTDTIFNQTSIIYYPRHLHLQLYPKLPRHIHHLLILPQPHTAKLLILRHLTPRRRAPRESLHEAPTFIRIPDRQPRNIHILVRQQRSPREIHRSIEVQRPDHRVAVLHVREHRAAAVAAVAGPHGDGQAGERALGERYCGLRPDPVRGVGVGVEAVSAGGERDCVARDGAGGVDAAGDEDCEGVVLGGDGGCGEGAGEAEEGEREEEGGGKHGGGMEVVVVVEVEEVVVVTVVVIVIVVEVSDDGEVRSRTAGDWSFYHPLPRTSPLDKHHSSSSIVLEVPLSNFQPTPLPTPRPRTCRRLTTPPRHDRKDLQ